MQQPEAERISVEESDDLVRVRGRTREAAIAMGFGRTDQVRVVTAVSELARNILRYAEKGLVEISRVKEDGRIGLRVKFQDGGPGIADIKLAMEDGYTTGGGLGKGLPGAKRLVDDFEIESEIGKGTVVTITKWV
ncbi:MAG TPA: ATP-binding protein [Blastocatellia bacterium]|nr:ATP-binding protein [Blastocatellia bacterium]